MMSTPMKKNDGAEEGVPSLEGPRDEGETGFPAVTAHPGTPAIVQAGAGVSATGQVDREDFILNPPVLGVEKVLGASSAFNLVGISRNKDLPRECLNVHTMAGNKNPIALGQLDVEKEKIEVNANMSILSENDDFTTPPKESEEMEVLESEGSDKNKTIVEPILNMSNSDFIKDKQVEAKRAWRPSGSEVRKAKMAKQNEEKKEEVELDPRQIYISRSYNIANRTYSQAAKSAGGLMLEIRSDNIQYLLTQEDFEEIDTECGILFKTKGMEGDRKEYKIKGGLSQGGVWVTCKNQHTLDIVKEIIPTLSSPRENGGKFKCFKEDEKPFIYLQARIPGRWWPKREHLESLIMFGNRWLMDPLECGHIPHFRISGGMEKKKMNKAGFFEITCEIDEKLFPVIAKKKGEIEISMSTTKFYGSGIVSEAKKMLGKEYDEQMDNNVVG